jgi:hypothetical protein
MLVSDLCLFVEREVGAGPAARARRVPCLDVCERGGVCVFGAVGVGIRFEVGVSVGYGFP